MDYIRHDELTSTVLTSTYIYMSLFVLEVCTNVVRSMYE